MSLLAGQVSSLESLIGTLTTVEQVSAAMALVEKFDDYCRGKLGPLCRAQLAKVTNTSPPPADTPSIEEKKQTE